MRPPQNAHSAAPVVTAPQLSVRLTLVMRAVRVEDAVWNATEPVAYRGVLAATVRYSVRVRHRRASKFVQLTETGVP